MKGTKYKAGGGANKNVKYRSGGGGMMKGTKGFTKGGAALKSEMQANPGMGNMPKSVMSALMGAGTRAQGQANVLRQPKGMTRGGGMKATKYRAGGGANKNTKGRSTGGGMSNLAKGIKKIIK